MFLTAFEHVADPAFKPTARDSLRPARPGPADNGLA